jgi:hypothetical protein
MTASGSGSPNPYGFTPPPAAPPSSPGRLGGPFAPHRGGMVLALGILSIVISGCGVGLILGFIAMNMAKTDIAQMNAGLMDPAGRGLTDAGRICGIIGACLGGVGLLFLCVYLGFIIFVVGAGAAGAAGGAGPGGGGTLPFILGF